MLGICYTPIILWVVIGVRHIRVSLLLLLVRVRMLVRMSTVRLLLVVRLVMLLGRRHSMLVIVGLGVSGGVLSSVMGLLFGIPVL